MWLSDGVLQIATFYSVYSKHFAHSHWLEHHNFKWIRPQRCNYSQALKIRLKFYRKIKVRAGLLNVRKKYPTFTQMIDSSSSWYVEALIFKNKMVTWTKWHVVNRNLQKTKSSNKRSMVWRVFQLPQIEHTVCFLDDSPNPLLFGIGNNWVLFLRVFF